jgi:hypothetical protein
MKRTPIPTVSELARLSQKDQGSFASGFAAHFTLLAVALSNGPLAYVPAPAFLGFGDGQSAPGVSVRTDDDAVASGRPRQVVLEMPGAGSKHWRSYGSQRR